MEKITLLPNPFDKHQREVHEGNYEGQKLSEIEIICQSLDGLDLIYSKDGEIIDSDYIIKKDDEINVVCKVTGGSSKDILRMGLQIGLMAALAFNPAGWFSTPLLGFNAFFFNAAVGIAGSYIINFLLPPNTPDIGPYDDIADGNTYGWGETINDYREGTILPILYGTHKINPSLIERYTQTSTDGKQTINLLFGVADGEIDSISNVKINGNDSSNYTDVVIDVTTNLGTNTPSALTGFAKSRFQENVGVEMTANDYFPTAGGQYVDNDGTTTIYCVFNFPRGIYRVASGSTMANHTVKIRPEYSATGSAPWSPLIPIAGDEEFTEKSQSPFKRIISGTVPSGKYYIRAACTHVRHEGDVNYGDQVVFSHIIAESPYGSYYPNTALMSVRALATENLNGGKPDISCEATRSTVQVWTGSSYESKDATNPAWACYDLIHNDLYGAGVPYDEIIYDDFNTWATFCSTNSYTVNIYLDTQGRLSDALNKISVLGRGVVVQRGTKFGAIYDGVASATQLFNVSNMIEDSFSESFLSKNDRANIIRVTYYDASDEWERKVIEVRSESYDLGDEIEKPYEVNLIGCTNKTMASKYGQMLMNSNKYLVRTIQFSAYTDALVAEVGDVIQVQHDVPLWSEGGRVVSATNNTVTIDKEITFPMSFNVVSWKENYEYPVDFIVIHNGVYYKSILESINVEPGIGPGWMSYWTTTVLNYYIEYRDNDTDTLYTEAISDPGTGDWSTLTKASGNWTVNPAKSDLYMIGVENVVGKSFRITDISITSDNTVEVTAGEYYAEIYDDTISAIPDYPNESYLDAVSNVRADDVFLWGKDGEIRDVSISVTWTGEAVGWYVFLDDGNGYTSKGYTEDNNRIISQGIEIGKTYTVSVSDTNDPYKGQTDTVTISVDPPDAVTALTSDVLYNNVQLKWKAPSSDIPISYYEVRKGSTYASGSQVGQVGNKNFINFVENLAGTYTYWVAAVDTAGNVGTAASVQATIITSSDYSLLDSDSTDFSGTKTDCVIENGSLIGPIDSSETWEEHFEDNVQTNFQGFIDDGYTYFYEPIPSGNTSFSYEETSAIDLGVEYASCSIRLDVAYTVISGDPNQVGITVDFIKTSDDDISYDTETGQIEITATETRYVKYKFTITVGANTMVRVDSATINVVGKELTESGSDSVSDSGTGKTITLTKGFSEIQSVNITPVSTTTAVGARYSISQPNQFTVKLYNDSGTSVTGGFSYTVTGV